MAEKLAGAAPSVTAPKQSRPEQQRRGRLFLSVYVSVILLATAGFTGLAVFVRQQDVITNFDAPVAQAIQSINLPVVSWILVHMSDLGWAPLDIICVAGIAVTLFALRLRLEAVLVVVATLAAGELGTLAKGFVQRARPTASFVHLAGHLADFSFPSGHVIFATVLFGTTFAVVWIVWASSLLRNAVLVLLAALVLLMGPSRIYLGEHWPTDVIGAYCLGGLCLAVTVEVLLALRPRVGPWWQGARLPPRLEAALLGFRPPTPSCRDTRLVRTFDRGAQAIRGSDRARAEHRRPGDPGDRPELRLCVDRAAARPLAAWPLPGDRRLRHRRRHHSLVVSGGPRPRNQDRHAGVRGQSDLSEGGRPRAQPSPLPGGLGPDDGDHGAAQS